MIYTLFWIVHLMTCDSLHTSIILPERKFVLIDQNFVHSPDALLRRRERDFLPTHKALKFFSFPPSPLSRPLPFFLSLSLFFSLSLSFSFYLSRYPVDVSNGNFFPSRKKHSVVYLKRRDFIAHSRGNDTLSNNHLARIPWSRAIKQRRFCEQWNFWRIAKSWKKYWHWHRKNPGNVILGHRTRVNRVRNDVQGNETGQIFR